MSSTQVAVKAAKSAASTGRGGVVSIKKKYTLEPTGIWERIRRLLVIEPNRSSGVPLNARFRNPPPGANAPELYDDPTTLPAADLAENPYWKRDARRQYARPSVLTQADVAGLLTVGSRARPREDRPALVGEAGARQLVEARRLGEERGLAAVFERGGEERQRAMAAVLGPSGLPPLPYSRSGGTLSATADAPNKRYAISDEAAYPDGYPCRNFT